MPARPVLIVGMHRSGTSCLAGCLEEAGLHLGEVNTAAPFNKKGNREHPSVMSLQESVLAARGGAWNTPPAEPVVWSEAELHALRDVLADFPADRRWGVKDPRTLLMMSGWRQLVKPQLVGTYRHPDEVCRSLMKRAEAWKQPMELSQAQDIWCVYNRYLLAEYDRQAFPILRYGSSAYADDLTDAVRWLGLQAPEKFAFPEQTLHNNRVEDAGIPVSCQEIWNALEAARADWRRACAA